MIELEKFQKHIVLYCKGQYDEPKGDKGFFEGLKMIWSVRCGYGYDQCSSDVLSYIANDMYKIVSKCMPEKLPYLMDLIHRELTNSIGKPKNLTPIEALVFEYGSLLSNIQVREKVGEDYQWVVNLENPQPELFNRILSGGGEYGDYNLVK